MTSRCNNPAHGTQSYKRFADRDAYPSRHGRTDKREDRNEQQCISLQDAQWARRFTEYHLHVQRTADQGEADDTE